MKKYLLLAAFLLGCLQVGQVLAVPDSCLTLYCPNDGVSYNPDKVMIDTCKDSPTYGDWFQSGIWTIGFNKYFFKDSMNDGLSRDIKDLDSIKYPDTYKALKSLEEKFGEITFIRDYNVCSNDRDSSFHNEPCLNIYFSKRNRTKDVEYYLGQLPGIRFVRMANYPLKSKIPASCLTEIWPHNPPDSYNPDYIMKDTCYGSPTYGKRYRRGTFCIALDKYVFSYLIPAAYHANIDDIDTIKYKEFRDSCISLEKRFGEISFYRDPYICNNRYDTFFLTEPCLAVSFSKYGLSDSLYAGLGNLPRVGGAIWFRYVPYPSRIDDINKIALDVQPNPCCDKLKIKNIEVTEITNQKIEIYNYLGSKILTLDISNCSNDLEFDVSYFDEGIYFIKINDKLLKFIKLE